MGSRFPELGRFADSAILVLVSLSDGPKHGYAIMTDVEAGTGRPLGPGTLYATLARLEERGFIEALPPVDRRRPYRLTGLGATVLAEHLTDLAAFARLGLRRLGQGPAMRSLLIRLFPARWRVRYGDEFEAMLDERPMGPFDVADVLLAALDAHLHRHGLAGVPQPPGGFTMSLRIGGYVAIIGGILWFSGLAYASATAGAGADAARPLAILAMVIGNASLLVALAGLSAFQARRYPRMTWAAFILPALGAIISIVGVLAMEFVGDRPFVGDVSPWYVWMLGWLTLIVGSAIFAAVTWRTAALPRPPAALLAASALVILPGLALTIGGIVPEAVAAILALVCLVAFAAGWVAVGWSALRLDRAAVERTGAA
ncbi:MAG: PadR family transcriptional regulator [Chloroflexi bacterium]|nr:PadR family transcriptional regulator [Chloroflexota bacterium]